MQVKYKLADVRGVVSEFAKNRQNHPQAHKLSQMMEQIFEEHQDTSNRVERLIKDLRDAEKDIKRLKTLAAREPTTIVRYDSKSK